MTSQWVVSAIIASICGLIGGGGIGALLRLRTDNRKTRADTADILIDSAEQLVQLQLPTIKRLEKELDDMEKRLSKAEAKVKALTDELDVERRLRRSAQDETERLRALADGT